MKQVMHKVAMYRPKAREMEGFNKNWETEDLVEVEEERNVSLQERMQEEKIERGGDSEEPELQSHQERAGIEKVKERKGGGGPVELEEDNMEEEGEVRLHKKIQLGTGTIVNEDEEEIGEYMDEHQDPDESKEDRAQEEGELEEAPSWIQKRSRRAAGFHRR